MLRVTKVKLYFFQEQACSKFNYECGSIFRETENYKLSVIYNCEI